MRIAMFMPELEPGALGALIYRDLAAAVAERGHSFECLGSGTGEREDDHGVRPLQLSPGWLRAGKLTAPWLRTPRIPAYVAALAAWLGREGRSLDVLHIEIAYPTGAAAALAVAASGWKGVLSISPMGEDLLVVPEASYGFRRHLGPRLLVDWTMRRATLARAISPLMRERIEREWPSLPCRAIPLNVVQRAIDRLAEPAIARAEQRIAARRAIDGRYPVAGKPLVLALGRLHPFKAVDVLVEAMASLPDAHLLVAGPSLRVRPFGDVASALAEQANRLGVADRVTLLGRVPPADALDLLAGADVLAVSSHLESMNRVCVEAAAVGTPFVVTETTGIAGWLPGAGVGLVVPPRNPRALAAAIREVIDGDFKRDGARTEAFVRQFAPDRVAAALLEEYASRLASAR